jgi:hypothetical protein
MKKLLCLAVVAMFFATSGFAQVPQQQQQNNYPQTQPQPTTPNQQQNTYPQQNNGNQSVTPQGNQNTLPQNQNVVPPPSSTDTTITPPSNRAIDTGANPNSNRVDLDTSGTRGKTNSSGTYNPPRL